MDWTVFFSAFLGSSVVVALVAGLVSLRTSERQIAIENVTKERTKWREKIRATARDIHAAAVAGDLAKLQSLHLDMALSLNPDDHEDAEILRCIRVLDSNNSDTTELTYRLALLLKHDWERAKWECRRPWWRPFREPRRIKFADCKFCMQATLEGKRK